MPYHRDNLNGWVDRAELDFFTAFIRAWIPFNAWYKNAYDIEDEDRSRSDRDMLNDVKRSDNVIRSGIMNLLERGDSEGVLFKSHIALLHEQLERVSIIGKYGRLRFTYCFVGANERTTDSLPDGQTTYKVTRRQNQQNQNRWETVYEITYNARSVFAFTQNKHDLAVLQAKTNEVRLSANRCANIVYVHNRVAPLDYRDLLNTENNREVIPTGLVRGVREPAKISCGTYQFCDNPDLIFRGLVEILYGLRNQVFHGGIVPTSDNARVYEPAYFLLLRFLQCLREAPR